MNNYDVYVNSAGNDILDIPNTFALVAVEKTTYRFDQAFTYWIPGELRKTALPGCRVLVPFGGGNRTRIGMILETRAESDIEPCKPIAAVLDEAPLLNRELLSLAPWLKEHTFCNLYDAVKIMLPGGLNRKIVHSFAAIPAQDESLLTELSAEETQVYEYLCGRNGYVRLEAIQKKLGVPPELSSLKGLLERGLLASNLDAVRNVGDATRRMVRLREETEEALPKLSKKQREIVDLLTEIGTASVKEVCYYTGLTPSVVAALEKKDVVCVYEVLRERKVESLYNAPEGQTAPVKCISLTEEQESCYDNLMRQYQSDGGTSLLFGVTGSGKTQVFLRMLDAVLAEEKSAIVMVPEIALTPQMLSLFRGRYGPKVALFHSALSAGERVGEWKRVKNGEAQIALGTRSAVFAPFENLGLLILDEEQEHTYKSKQSPRYAAKDVARRRAAWHRALVILASATPSVESYAAALSGQYSLNVLSRRYGDAVLPQVQTVGLSPEALSGQAFALSEALLEALRENLSAQKQSILLINRRGYHSFVLCQSCKEVLSCPSCSISLTYHAANHRLMCHYCGYSRPFSDTCARCGAPNLRCSGYGTQRVEAELREALPEARVLRMDMDTTAGRFAHETKLEQFRRREFDILLGTQMVAKGLDFEQVTLVGVVSADQQLYNDDFRSLERSFSLLTQVVGRAGRGQYPGKAIIQTMNPENPILRFAERQDYAAFYETEIKIRKLMIYPPYCDICVLGFACEEEPRAKAASKATLQLLSARNAERYPDVKMIILGPMAARIAKIGNRFRYRLIIKAKNTKRFRAMLSELLVSLDSQPAFSGVAIYADINPRDTI